MQWVTQYSNTYETNCNLPTSRPRPERCDDPTARAGGLDDPIVMSTLSLQTINTYVGSDTGTSSHPDYSYSFTYQESPFSGCTDGLTLSPAYCAGNHLLTSITPTVYQNGTPHILPAATFAYTQYQNSYIDTGHKVDTDGDPPTR